MNTWGGESNLIVKPKKPLKLYDLGDKEGAAQISFEFADSLKKKGFDGIIVNDPHPSSGGYQVVVFDPNKIKAENIVEDTDISPEQLSKTDIIKEPIGKPSIIEQPEKLFPLPTLADVQEVFKGQEVTQLKDGSIAIKTQGGHDLIVRAVDSISPDLFALRIGHGREALSEGETVAGKYQEGTIEIVKDAGDKWTLHHESIHFMEDMGIVTKNEISLLQKHITNLVRDGKYETVNKADIGGAEDRANFLADALTKEPKGFLGRIIIKIKDFVNKLVNAFGIRIVGGIAREIKTGEIYGREGVRGEAELGEKYAVTKKPGIDRTELLVEEAKSMAKAKAERETKSAETKKLTSSISNTINDIVEKARASLIEQTPHKIKEGVEIAKVSMIEHDRNIRHAEFTSKQLKGLVEDSISNKDRQMLMIHAAENKMKGKWWNQLNNDEKSLVEYLMGEKEKINKYIDDNDILERMQDTKDITHVYHYWIDPATKEPYKPMYGKFSKGLPQAKQRTIPTYEAGIERGMTPASANLGEIIGLELESATRANNARQLVKSLYGIKGDPETSIVLRKGGKPQPISMVEGWDLLTKQGLTEGYVRYDSSFLDKPIVFKSSSGKPIMIKGAIGVKEELYPFVRAYIENPSYGNLSQLGFVTKSLRLGLSMFHVVSLGMQEATNLRIPFIHIPNGLKAIKERSPELKLLYQEGLELYKGYEDLGYRNKFFDGGSVLGKTGNIATYPIVKIRDFIFDYVQPGIKVSFGMMQLNKLLPRYLKKTGWIAEEALEAYESGKPMPQEVRDRLFQCAREVVQKCDGHFSGEHYKRSLLETNRFMVKLYFTPEARKAWQIALLSPT